MDYCLQSDLPMQACAHCRGFAKKNADDPSFSRTFKAMYPGTCEQPGCGNRIESGDSIRYIEDRLACRRCA